MYSCDQISTLYSLEYFVNEMPDDVTRSLGKNLLHDIESEYYAGLPSVWISTAYTTWISIND